MLSVQVEQIINTDIALLNRLDSVQGRIGRVLGHGTYGFVCEWNDGSREAKVVKVRDPEYIQKKNSIPEADVHTLLLASASGAQHKEQVCEAMQQLVAQEQYASEKLAGTKHPNLMRILNGTQYVELDGRDVLLIIMPRLQTIQQLPVSSQPEAQIVEILCDCCDGLQVLHADPQSVHNQRLGPEALVHGDLKPDNIFVWLPDPKNPADARYIVGDYSSCLRLAQLRKYPQLRYPSGQSRNPYCAPGPIGIASDIWSLGWILWYWMNGKVHPTAADISSRSRPKNWGDNPELWEVFLKMTDRDPSKRHPCAAALRAELKSALARRQERLAREASDSDKLEGALTAGLIGAGAYLVYKLVGALFGDRSGASGGSVRKEADFLGGTFRGEWRDGMPVQGDFTYQGIKKSGRWAVRQDYTAPFSPFGTITFSGLIHLDSGEDLYHGVARIQWEHGTQLDCPIIAGDFSEGTMTFANGQMRKTGRWRLVDGEFTGVACEDASGFYGCGIRMFAEDTFYEGALWQDIPQGGDLVLPNRRIPYRDSQRHIAVWNLLRQMEQHHGRFCGSWDASGHPAQGAYTFSTGQTLRGNFSYTSGDDYTGMVLNGKACGIGQSRLDAQMHVHGEFRNGDCHGFATVHHQCGASLAGIWKDNCLTQGELLCANGQTLFSKSWQIGQTTLGSGHVLQGIFCDLPQSPSGLGRLILMPHRDMFVGEFLHGDTGAGQFYDRLGDPTTEAQVNARLNNRR